MTRRSMTGFSILLGSNLVSWKTKKQATVSRSSAEAAEAEHWAMATLKSELQWLTYLLSDLGISPSSPIALFCDNQAATHIAENLVFHEHIKHVELDCHFVCEKRWGYDRVANLEPSSEVVVLLKPLDLVAGEGGEKRRLKHCFQTTSFLSPLISFDTCHTKKGIKISS